MKKTLILTGPTATGKTSFGVKLARRLQGEIISADSRQVYTGLDIGSGKDLAEYTMADGYTVPAHLLDIADPVKAAFSLADFLLAAQNTMQEIEQRGAVSLVVGGTALWIHALLAEYQLTGGSPDNEKRKELRALSLPELQETLRALDPENPVLTDAPNNRTRIIRRIEMIRNGGLPTEKEQNLANRHREYLLMGVLRNRSEVRRNIEIRLDERLSQGMLNEAVRLHERGVSWETLEFFGLEYRYMALHLQGKLSYDEMRSELLNKIRQFAKRQDSWFRKMERDGYPIYWFRPDELEQAVTLSETFLAGGELPEPAFRLSDVNWKNEE